MELCLHSCPCLLGGRRFCCPVRHTGKRQTPAQDFLFILGKLGVWFTAFLGCFIPLASSADHCQTEAAIMVPQIIASFSLGGIQ